MERKSLSDILGDFVAFRNLEPADKRLKGLAAVQAEVGLPAGHIPRKVEPDYAAVVAHLLRQAQALRGAGRPLEQLIYIGDTRGSDGSAARHLGQQLELRAFIGEDKLQEPPQTEVQGAFTFANRWSALGDWVRSLEAQGFALDASLAVVVDLDKTAIGARGRNDRPIDQARVDAARDLVSATLDGHFQMEVFRPIYDELHKTQYHPFTADNQDYLVYTSLMATAGVYDFQSLVSGLDSKQVRSFQAFVALCGERLSRPEFEPLRPIHNQVAFNVSRNDPTPFKDFRCREYECTVARMDFLPDDTPREQLLVEEITLTKEVADAAAQLRQQGALLFGLSDKPDEASLPRAELISQGYQPLHRVKMKVVGATAA